MTYVPALHHGTLYDLSGRLQTKAFHNRQYGQAYRTHVRVYTWVGVWLYPSNSWMDEELGKQLVKDLSQYGGPGGWSEIHTGSLPQDDVCLLLCEKQYALERSQWHSDADRESRKPGNKRKGTNGEINLILISLLKKAGLEPLPLMVSTHAHGKIDFSNPSPEQFNRLMVYINVNDLEYVLDAADKFSSPKLIPWDVQYSNQLVIYSNGITDDRHLNIQSELKPFWDKKAAFKDLVQIQGNIDDEGLLTGDATVTSYEYSREKKMADLQQGKDQFLDKYFNAGNSAVHIDSSIFANENVDTLPLKQKVWFNEKLTSSGNYKYFTTNLFTGFENNPFPADRRISDVFWSPAKLQYCRKYFYPGWIWI